MRRDYSTLSLIRHGLSDQKKWRPAWRNAAPQKSYDMVIIGGGGHGLATAYYLAKQHGVKSIAVLEKGWIGGGNTGRNTTLIRSNYFFPESAKLYDFSLSLYEGLSKELNYNIMFSQRGMWTTAHDRHSLELVRRSTNAMLLNGVDAEFHSGDEIRKRIPLLNDNPRYPILGGVLQKRAGTARHDAVAWGYARGADAYGVDIIQGCEVVGLKIQKGRVQGVQTTRGNIKTGKVGIAVAGNTTVLANMAGFRVPVVSHALQAFVSEPVKPILNTVLLSSATGVYVSQSDKGELVLGSVLDLYGSYAQRGNLPTFESSAAGLIELFPSFSRMRFLRQWAGIVDIVHDSSPIVGKTPVEGLYINCGWGTGGFKAIPAGGYCLADTMVKDQPHPLVAPFDLERFETGALIDEAAGAAIAH